MVTMTQIDVLKSKNIMGQELTCHSNRKKQISSISMMPIDVLKTKEIKAPEVTLPCAQKKHEKEALLLCPE
jgi:hypothetical protein